ncbi:MAG: hypothetical protein WCK49_00535 [Myxococcaceae bacterium]
MLKFITLILSVLFLVGCQAHVQLSAPPLADAPIKERVKAYDELKPIVHRELYIVNGYGGVSSNSSSLTLGNGQRIYHPEDLLPVVGPNNKFAESTQQYLEYNRLGTTFMWSGLGVEILGTSLMLAGIPRSFGRNSGEIGPTFAIGAGMVVLGLVGVIVGYIFEAKSSDYKASAFDVYDSVLLKRLELARTGTNTVLVPTNQVE